MGWLRSVGLIKLQVSLAEYGLFYRALLQKRPIILSILLTEATPYVKDTKLLQFFLETVFVTYCLTHCWTYTFLVTFFFSNFFGYFIFCFVRYFARSAFTRAQTHAQ